MNYTTIKQSKRLLELGVNPESADLIYCSYAFDGPLENGDEDKQLLLIDLCARWIYGVKVAFEYDGKLITDTITMIGWPSNEFMLFEAGEFFTIEEIKPYLRSMSNMTKEEEKEFKKVVFDSQNIDGISASTYVSDWLISKHFDVRGLIPKGLALEAPEGMYN